MSRYILQLHTVCPYRNMYVNMGMWQSPALNPAWWDSQNTQQEIQENMATKYILMVSKIFKNAFSFYMQFKFALMQ